MVPLLNIHTHCEPFDGEQTVPSYGLHPWHVADDWQQRVCQVEHDAEAAGGNLFIGECGLDRLHADTYELQLQAFEAQIALSERLSLPMMVHCVKAWDDLLRLRRHTTQPWVVHGFRGNPQLMDQLLSHGIMVSFGFRYNAGSVASCPPDRFFLETDDVPSPISPLYAEVALQRRTTTEQLRLQMMSNLIALFPTLY